jgi:hypothetical protein
VSTFMGELAKKLADKWLTLLVLPGLLLLVSAVAGYLLRGRAWNDVQYLSTQSANYAQALAKHGNVGIVLAVAAVLLASAAAGLAANTARWLIAHLWMAHRLAWPGKPLTWWRKQRWDAAQNAALTKAQPPGQPARATEPGKPITRLLCWWNRIAPGDPNQRRNRIGLAAPHRPTWIGDRVAATSTRVENQYGLDLTGTWPRLWPLLPDAMRTDITAARTAFDQTITLAGWGLLYIVVGVWTGWWPVLLAGIGTYLAAWYRARNAIVTLTELVEAAVDLHAATLAKAFGVPVADGGLVDLETGRRITARARKGT